MPIRRRAWLTREGWYYLAVLAFIIGGAVLRSVNLLVILAGTMIAPLLFNWRLVMASLTGLVVRRQLLTQVPAGETLTVQIDVDNTRWWMSSWLVTAEDWIAREEPGIGLQKSGVGNQAKRLAGWWQVQTNAMRVEARIPHVPAGGRAMGTYRVTLGRRGRYRFGPLRISTRFPLGLVQGRMTLPEYGELIVGPRLGRLLPAWASLVGAELVGDERRHPQRGLTEGDYYGLRPWQSGDSLRWIHWRTTAKLARPIVRQYERRQSRDVALLLDPWLPAGASQREEGLVELAISLMATAISDIVSRGHSRLTVAIAGPTALCTTGPASNLFCEELHARLAELAAGHDYRLADLLNRALETAPRSARLIVISSRSSDAPSLTATATELPIDPEDLTWIDTGSERLESLFSLSP